LDGSEVSRQLEDLTGVVLSSAEVSTRSAEVAATISEEMRSVMVEVDEMGKRNVLHSRVMLIGLLSFLMIAVGSFFAISTRLQQNIRQLDTLSLAVGKRVVELDATLGGLWRCHPRAWATPPKSSTAWKSVKSSSTAKSKPRWKT
jgi:hypothetical protein